MSRLLVLLLAVVPLLAQPIRPWRLRGQGSLVQRPTTCSAGDVYFCIGSGCTANSRFHYCINGVWEVQGGTGVPYEATFSSATSVSATAATHLKGTNPVVLSCYDDATPRNSIVYSTGYPTVAANGDVVVAWTGAKNGSCFISDGSGGGIGPTGTTGATGPAGADGANISEIQWVFAGCNGGTAYLAGETPSGNGDAAPTAACNDTGSIQRPGASFSGSAVNSLEFTVVLPQGWTDTSNVTAYIDYISTAASPTGNSEWDLSTVCRGVGESWDGSFNAVQTITDAQVAQYILNQASQSSLTMTGCAAQKHFTIRVSRDGLNDSSNNESTALTLRLKRTS